MKSALKGKTVLFLILIDFPFVVSNIFWYLYFPTKNTLLLIVSLFISFLFSYFIYKLLINYQNTKERENEDLKVDYVSMAAHELRTPITVIHGYSKLLNEEAGKKFNNEEEGFLERIINSAANLSTLVDNLLNVSRIEKGTLQLDFRVTQLEDLIKETIVNLTELAKTKNQDLSFTSPPNKLSPVLIDKFKIGEVITNLIANAINYTPEGGKITVLIKQENHQIITSVSDTGIGISKEDSSKLFTKFFRAGGKLSTVSKGTGLGLFITKEIVNKHHGKVWVESEIGKGSTFYFSLPVATDTDIKNAQNENAIVPTKGFYINPLRNKKPLTSAMID